MVTWTTVPHGFVHGNLLGYKVFYRRQEDQNIEFSNITTSNLKLELKNLDKYTVYVMKVLAFTSKGNGVMSSNVTKITDEDGW